MCVQFGLFNYLPVRSFTGGGFIYLTIQDQQIQIEELKKEIAELKAHQD